jgi:1-acyl-sn-glycerol-3-phosphate acyltransferase
VNTSIQLVRSALFVLIFTLATVFHSTLCLLLLPWLPVKRRFRFVILLNRFVIWWFSVACGVKYEIEGLENLPVDGNGVLVSNHQSEWETFYLQIIVSPLCTVLKKELLRVPFFGWGLALINPIAIDRSASTNALKQIMQQGRDKLEQGFWVLIFPEGTRVKPGERKKFSKTGAVLAEKSGLPLVPVAHNAGEIWPAKGFRKNSGVLRVVVGEPIDPAGRNVSELYQESTEWIESTRQRISGQS